MTTLNEVAFGMNQYCTPSALSILTGKNTDQCAAVISVVSGMNTIKAVQTAYVYRALERLGFRAEEVPILGRSLYTLCCQLANVDGKYLVTVGSKSKTCHMVVIEVTNGSIYFCDNHTKKPIPANASARLLQEVIECMRVVPIPQSELDKQLLDARKKRLVQELVELDKRVQYLLSRKAEIEEEMENL